MRRAGMTRHTSMAQPKPTLRYRLWALHRLSFPSYVEDPILGNGPGAKIKLYRSKSEPLALPVFLDLEIPMAVWCGRLKSYMVNETYWLSEIHNPHV